MKKIRFYYWIISSLFKKHVLIIVVAAALGAVTFTQWSLIASYLPKPKPTHYVGRIGLYTLTTLPQDIQSLVSQGLTYVDQSGTPHPDLARDWKVIDDGKTYVFLLSEDATWQDGTPVTSADINYNLKEVTLEKPDDHTVVFKLEEPFSPFPNITSQPIFRRVNRSILQVINSTKIIGTGDYTITDIKLNGQYLEQISLSSPGETRTYRFYSTEKSALIAFQLGEIDIIEDITSIDAVKDWPNVTIDTALNFDRYATIFFNTKDPDLSDKAIRQALTYAIPDKPSDEDRALSPISPQSWAYNPQVKPYDYSLQDAKQLLEGKKTDIELELTTTPTFVHLADTIKASWEQLGFTVHVRVLNVPNTNQFQALLIGQQIPADPDQYLLWHSTQQTNITGYQSAKVDKLLEDGRTQIDQQKRKQIYQDFQRFLVEDTPAAFLYHLTSHTITRG